MRRPTRSSSACAQQKTELPPRNVLRKQVLERLIMEEIQMQRADRLGVEVSEEMLNGALDDVAKRNNIQFSDLPAALGQQGIDYRNFRDEIRKQLKLQLLRQRDVMARINISPRELEQFKARQANAPDQNSEYNISHILISVAGDCVAGADRDARGSALARCTTRRRAAKTSRSSPSRTPRAAPTSKAVRSAGAAARSCRRSSRTALRR